METEMIDKLYLELSHVTKAKTHREDKLEKAIKHLQLKVKEFSNHKFMCGLEYCDNCPLNFNDLTCLVPKQRNFSQ